MEIIIKYLNNAPTKFHGMVTRNSDESYTILLDPNDSRERQLRAYKHEIEHILGADFEMENVQEIERETHEQDIQAELLRRDRET